MDAIESTLFREKSRRLFLPFTIYGMNALFIFALSGLIAKMLGFIKFTQADGKYRVCVQSGEAAWVAALRAWIGVLLGA